MSGQKLRIASSSYHVGHAIAPMIAVEKGFFREEGFDNFELLFEGLIPSFVERKALSVAMKERGVQVVLGAQLPSVLALNSEGEDLYIMAGWRFVPQVDWYARPEIKSFADLKGKKVGIRDQGGTGPRRLLWNELRRAGLDPEKDITWVNDRIFAYHGTADHVEAMREGRVHCVQSGPPFSGELEKMGCHVILSARKLYPQGQPMGVVAARAAVIERESERLRAFLRGILRAFWLERNPGEFSYLADLEKRLRAASPSEEEQALCLFTSPDRLEKRPLAVRGEVPVEGLRSVAEELKETGELRADFRADGALRDGVARAAFQDLRSRKELQAEWERIQKVVDKHGY